MNIVDPESIERVRDTNLTYVRFRDDAWKINDSLEFSDIIDFIYDPVSINNAYTINILPLNFYPRRKRSLLLSLASNFINHFYNKENNFEY